MKIVIAGKNNIAVNVCSKLLSLGYELCIIPNKTDNGKNIKIICKKKWIKNHFIG